MSQFSAPASTQGVDLDAANGHLLIIEPVSQEHGVQTVHGPADPIRANVDDVDTGQRFEDVLLFPRVLISQLRPNIGKKVLGRLGRGVAKPGQSAPWVLNDAAGEDNAKAEAYLAKQGPTLTAPSVGGGNNGWGDQAPF